MTPLPRPDQQVANAAPFALYKLDSGEFFLAEVHPPRADGSNRVSYQQILRTPDEAVARRVFKSLSRALALGAEGARAQVRAALGL